ncbi:unnamed protein product [Cylicocyclus nassatus]|uniref:Uncharacterized protein n=1 Tax=Cylicocyclus nassatus TaxID=53992 RepID=A0AA36M4P8_CYLNA|nr:unnamed protein product [Cylicocyclus nassatus]
MVDLMFRYHAPAVIIATTSSLINIIGRKDIFNMHITRLTALIGNEASQIPEPVVVKLATLNFLPDSTTDLEPIWNTIQALESVPVNVEYNGPVRDNIFLWTCVTPSIGQTSIHLRCGDGEGKRFDSPHVVYMSKSSQR